MEIFLDSCRAREILVLKVPLYSRRGSRFRFQRVAWPLHELKSRYKVPGSGSTCWRGTHRGPKKDKAVVKWRSAGKMLRVELELEVGDRLVEKVLYDRSTVRRVDATCWCSLAVRG